MWHAFYHSWILRYGPPDTIVTDRGANFQSTLFQEQCRDLGVRHNSTTAYHPQANGTVERIFRHMGAALDIAMMSTQTSRWDEALPQVVQGHNAAVSTSRGHSPFYLFHGWQPRLPSDLPVPTSTDTDPDAEHSIDNDREAAAATRTANAAANATRWGGRREDITVGTHVWLRDEVNGSWSGPHEVLETPTPFNVVLRLPQGSRTHPRVHISRVRKAAHNNSLETH